MNDQTLLEMLRARDEKALAELSKQYRGYCITILGGVLNDEQDREECFNDLLLKIWNADLPQGTSLKGLIGTTARNLAVDRYKSLKREKRGAGAGCEALEELESFLSRDDVESVLENKALAKALNDFLRALDKNERQLFIRRYYFLESTESLSQRFAISGGCVLRRLSRTRKKLKRYLEKEGFYV